METKNLVYIGTSIDGYIADKDGGLDYLESIPNPTGDDMGYSGFMDQVDAVLMGRNSFETILGFDVDWPYPKPVFVLSQTLTAIPQGYEDKAYLVSGSLSKVLASIHQQGYTRLYIDGGKTIQSFLKEDRIDEMIITTIPVLLGGGISLFGDLDKPLAFTCTETKHLLGQITQNKYVRVRAL